MQQRSPRKRLQRAGAITPDRPALCRTAIASSRIVHVLAPWRPCMAIPHVSKRRSHIPTHPHLLWRREHHTSGVNAWHDWGRSSTERRSVRYRTSRICVRRIRSLPLFRAICRSALRLSRNFAICSLNRQNAGRSVARSALAERASPKLEEVVSRGCWFEHLRRLIYRHISQ